MKTRISSKGQIVLPAELRRQDHIRAGQQFEVERIEAGQYLLKKVKKPKGGFDIVDWLFACPVKDIDWYKPIPSEATDQIKNPFES